MARIEFPAELLKRIDDSGATDLMVGITGSADPESLRAKVVAALRGTATKVVVAYAGDVHAEPVVSINGIEFVAYPLPQVSGPLAFWTHTSEAQRNVLALAAAWQARACLVTYADLIGLNADAVRIFIEPVLQGKSDLVMPVYPDGRYDGLINKSMLAPLYRALYGKRVRFPLPFDFCAGSNALAKISASGANPGQTEPQLLWPADAVATNGGQISQAAVNIRHAPQTDGMDLSGVLTELAGSLFQEVETRAADWQRVRGSQAVHRYGEPLSPKEDSQVIDPRPMVESFALASRNLEEVWRLVLPPATMLELVRLARLSPEQFRMPDALWARIIYDFALAYRLRRLSRTHVLGSLTPLYLGWVASYTQEVGGATAEQADSRIEQLARMFEEQKPYFVSRWRWPQRAN